LFALIIWLRDYCPEQLAMSMFKRLRTSKLCFHPFHQTYRVTLNGLDKSMERQFTAIIEKRGKWFVATVEEIPGVNTQGRTLAEARRNLKEAILLVVEATRELITVRV
jgi:predicted RNase H-like HicB family nuclease